MKFEKYLIAEGVLDSALRSIKGKSANAVKKIFSSAWEKLVQIIKDKGLEKDALRIINRHSGGSFRSLDSVSKGKIQEGTELNEDFAHWWKWMKDNAWPAGAIFSSLQIFFELDKLIFGGAPADMRKLVAYGAVWVLLVSGKYLFDWQKWTKDNPEEYEKEKEAKKQLKTAREKIRYTFRGL